MNLEIYKQLKTVFGYDEFRPLQEDIINRTLEGKESLVLMPTGGGKSICFQIPALCMSGMTLVVSPLISLMKDQVQALQSNGVNAAYFNSSLNSEDEQNVIESAINGDIKILYLSPEKLISIKDQWIKNLDISLVAIDEAHCVSMWGHDFRPEYTQLRAFRISMPDIPFMALTATADKSTRKDIISQLGLSGAKSFISSFDRPNISLEVKGNIPLKQKLFQITNFIKSKPNESGIIYALSRKNTEEISTYLRREGLSVDYYHAGMNSEDRDKVQSDFINDTTKIVVATIAFGMGIDKSNVRWVIHSNLPKNLEGYYQEIGRSGRDGLPAESILYYNMRDVVLYQRFAKEGANTEMQLEKLNRMLQFAEAKTCRRKILLSYFGEHRSDNCDNCDACHNPPAYIDGTIIAQKALSAVARTDEDENATMIINILRGSQNADIYRKGYQHMKTFGVGREDSFYNWRDYIVQLVNLGTMEIAYSEHSALKITSFGWRILKGELKISLVQPVKYKDKSKAKEIKSKTVSLDLGVDASKLFENLRGLRYMIAQKEGMPAYIIFSDKSLKEMAIEQPKTIDEFLDISGVGKVKMEKYGSLFLKEIKKHDKT